MTASATETAADRLVRAAGPARGVPSLLLMFGEMALKGRKRSSFAAALQRNLRLAMRRVGEVEIHRRGSSFVVFPPPDGLATVLEVATELPGLSVVQPALRVQPDVARAAGAAVALLRDTPAASFAVRARRREKSFPVGSMEIARLVGATINERLGFAVDLSHPDVELRVDAYTRELFVSVDRLRGAGGLPVGTSGRALVLLSGGIDSPVAAYRMMKRGLRCDFVHFSGQPLTGPESAYKAYALVARLNRFQGRARLFVVPFGLAQRQLASSGAGRLQVLAQRRLMVRVADAIARREKCEALVTGDSLGQVASQTLRNLEVVEGASTLPMLRPLLDRDKSEIVEQAERLRTFEISILPDEDCCTLLAPSRAVTWTDPEPLIELERRVDVETVVERLVKQALEMWPRIDQAASQFGPTASPSSSSPWGTPSSSRPGSGTRAAVSASSPRPSEGMRSPPWASDAITAR
jgi:thiamine biosynthesis protein ThiI